MVTPALWLLSTWYGIWLLPHELTGREEPDRPLSEFLLRTCHDLRSSLRAVQAHAALLQKDSQGQQSARFEQHLNFILKGARRIDLLAEGLASYAVALQIDEASFRATRMEVVLRTAMAKLAQEIREHSAEVTSGELPRVLGNPDRLAQVFEILISNALRHGTEVPPRIQISAERKSDQWLFAVRDNGQGIEPGSLERIFKPYERLHRREGEGVGLGLAICRALVERHGGRLWAESDGQSGSTFLFTLAVFDES